MDLGQCTCTLCGARIADARLFEKHVCKSELLPAGDQEKTVKATALDTDDIPKSV